jgi:hypothetical protein
MEQKDLLKQRLEINARYRQRIRDQRLAKAVEVVGFVSTVIICVGIVAFILILIFYLWNK